MANSYKKVVLSGYYGFDNFGDEAILHVLVEELQKQNFDVTVFSKNPQKTLVKHHARAINTFSVLSVINTIRKSDVLISGGGSLLQDATSLKSLFYYLFVIFTALFFKKKVIIFAQGIGPIKNIFGQMLTKKLLKHCDYITVRDEQSLFRVRGWGLQPELVNDPVWNVPLKTYMPLNRVGVQLRDWKRLSSLFLHSLAHQIATNFADREIYIYSFQNSIDYDLCKKFEGYLVLENPQIKTTIIQCDDIDGICQSVSNLEYMIAMRYHACLLALKYGIKTLALSYDEKVEKLAKRFDIPCSDLVDTKILEENFEALKFLDNKKLALKAQNISFDFTKIIEEINK